MAWFVGPGGHNMITNIFPGEQNVSRRPGTGFSVIFQGSFQASRTKVLSSFSFPYYSTFYELIGRWISPGLPEKKCFLSSVIRVESHRLTSEHYFSSRPRIFEVFMINLGSGKSLPLGGPREPWHGWHNDESTIILCVGTAVKAEIGSEAIFGWEEGQRLSWREWEEVGWRIWRYTADFLPKEEIKRLSLKDGDFWTTIEQLWRNSDERVLKHREKNLKITQKTKKL